MSDRDIRPIEPPERPMRRTEPPYGVTVTPPVAGLDTRRLRDVGTPRFARRAMMALVIGVVAIGGLIIIALLWFG